MNRGTPELRDTLRGEQPRPVEPGHRRQALVPARKRR